MKINAKSIVVLIVIICMLSCFCACGKKASTEETVEITTVAHEEKESSEKAENISVYESIYNEYNDKLKTATNKYAKEINAQVDSMSKDDLYDFVNKKVDELDKIREEGAQKMTDSTLNSKDDDQKEYKKWFSRLSETYSEYTRELTGIYTDQF